VAGSDTVLPGPEGIAVLAQGIDESELDVPFGAAYVSNVETVVPLAGEGITDVLGVGPNGFGSPDCGGGPRIFPGEKLMLFLRPSHGVLGGDCDGGRCGEWQSGQFGTPILFDGKDAYYLGWGRYSQQGEGATVEQRHYVGESGEVLAQALTYFGASQEQRERAFQFVVGTSAPPSEAQVPSTPAQSGGGVQIIPPDTGNAGLLVDSRSR
jgi:hypothetical protein